MTKLLEAINRLYALRTIIYSHYVIPEKGMSKNEMKELHTALNDILTLLKEHYNS
jgi:hypothetical protein